VVSALQHRRRDILTTVRHRRGAVATIVLNHTIVPARGKTAAALLRPHLRIETGAQEFFAPVRLNGRRRAATATPRSSHHYAFHVSDAEFDAIFDQAGRAHWQRPEFRGRQVNDWERRQGPISDDGHRWS
jgi:hypothetical protein